MKLLVFCCFIVGVTAARNMSCLFDFRCPPGYYCNGRECVEPTKPVEPESDTTFKKICTNGVCTEITTKLLPDGRLRISTCTIKPDKNGLCFDEVVKGKVLKQRTECRDGICVTISELLFKDGSHAYKICMKDDEGNEDCIASRNDPLEHRSGPSSDVAVVPVGPSTVHDRGFPKAFSIIECSPDFCKNTTLILYENGLMVVRELETSIEQRRDETIATHILYNPKIDRSPIVGNECSPPRPDCAVTLEAFKAKKFLEQFLKKYVAQQKEGYKVPRGFCYIDKDCRGIGLFPLCYQHICIYTPH